MSLAINPGGEVPTGMLPLTGPELILDGSGQLPQEAVTGGGATEEVFVDVDDATIDRLAAHDRVAFRTRTVTGIGTERGRRRAAMVRGAIAIAAIHVDRTMAQIKWDEE
jgi:hypothetical protein